MEIKFIAASGAAGGNLSPSAKRVIAFCSTLPDGDVIDVHGLLDAVKPPVSVYCVEKIRRSLDAHRYVLRGKAWYGNPKTIAAMKKQFA